VLYEFRKELERRKKLFLSAGASNYTDFREKTGSNIERWYLVIDEVGEALEIIGTDSSTDKEDKKLESNIAKQIKSLARLGRALGLNLIFGTQKPDVTVIEGQTRDMFGSRVCYKGEPNL
jgi:S-DNA-T family DNA segregation ATPase FtsK/SpoIIIE